MRPYAELLKRRPGGITFSNLPMETIAFVGNPMFWSWPSIECVAGMISDEQETIAKYLPMACHHTKVPKDMSKEYLG